MFKKSAQLKTSNPLKSSDRRKLLAHLQLAYPVLAHAPPQILARLVPDGLRVASALTSADDKCCFYTDDDGVPLWFELGAQVGVALSAAKGKKSTKATAPGTKNGAGQPPRVEGEVIPTLYALWIHPFILPQLTTWAAVIDDHLLAGSALMVPGLCPPPHTFRPCPLQLPPASSASTSATASLAAPTTAELPRAHSLVAITQSDSFIPLVVARLELSGENLIDLRSQPGGKGKAARVVHSFRDTIWEMGGKVKPPAEADFELAELVQQPEGSGVVAGGEQGQAGASAETNGEPKDAADAEGEGAGVTNEGETKDEEEEEEDLAAALEAVLMGANNQDEDEGTAPTQTSAEHTRKAKGKGKKAKHTHDPQPSDSINGDDHHQAEQHAPDHNNHAPSLSATQVDVVLRLALLNALSSLTPESASALLPLPASSLYSAHVLPGRPSHLPPRVGKGKGKAKATWLGWEDWKVRTSVAVGDDVEDGDGEGGEVRVLAEEADVKRSSAKQLKKWIKAAEKDGLLKAKDVRGELTVVELNVAHAELSKWTQLWTLADESAKAAAEEDAALGEGAPASAAAKKKDKNSPDRMGILVQSFYGVKSEATRQLFEVFGLEHDSIQSASSLRMALSDYITKRALAHPTNQALVRPGDDPALAMALNASEGSGTKAKKQKKVAAAGSEAAATATESAPPKEIMPEIKPMRRDDLARKLQDVLQEYHRLSFVRTSTANAILAAQTRPDPLSSSLLASETFQASLKEDERVGMLTKGPSTPISVSIKQRQGRKTVTLISGLEPYGVDPKVLAGELAREVGASTSVSALPGSTVKRPRVEVLVQGDVRRALFAYLEEEAGLDVARLVCVRDEVGGRKK
ncbi:unnamed protein product [Tilletia controversa]|nr:unnamed protein product [Tilletia controversa]